MSPGKTAAFLAMLLGIALLAAQAAAHGFHIWFVSPKQNAVVGDIVRFELEAPYARNRYVHISVTRDGETKPIWKDLIPLGDKKYSTQVDVKGWPKGKYMAKAILLGAVFQHPLRRGFIVE